MNTINTNSATRRQIPGHRLGVAILGAALISAAACGSDTSTTAVDTVPATTTTTIPTTTTAVTSSETGARPTATVDELVGVEGGRLHVRCTGQGATTVLLIAGFEAGADAWGTIEPAMSQSARVCSYDRFGTGTSGAPTSTQTFAMQANALHALLAAIGEPGPYTVVGHSFGGAQAVTFASLFADEVAALVLIDASPVTWPAAMCSVQDDGTETATTLRSFCTRLSDPTGNAEHLDAFESFAEVSGIVTLGSLPMTVITAVDRQFPGLGASELARLTDVWDQGQQRWLGLSTEAQLVSVEDTSHSIQLDRPDVVIQEITRLLP